MASLPEGWVNSVLEGDCIELMQKLPPGKIDMILCDLPYAITRNEWDTGINLSDLGSITNGLFQIMVPSFLPVRVFLPASS